MTTPDIMARALAQVEHPGVAWDDLDRYVRARTRVRAAAIVQVLAKTPQAAADHQVAAAAGDLITRYDAHCSQTVRDALENLWEVAHAARSN